MRQAIETKYLGLTDFKGSRIKAICQARSLTVHYRSELSSEENHKQAVLELIKLLGWDKYSKIVGSGQLKSGNYCFVLGDSK